MTLLEQQVASLVEQYGLAKVLRAIDLGDASPLVVNYLTDAIEALELQGKLDA